MLRWVAHGGWAWDFELVWVSSPTYGVQLMHELTLLETWEIGKLEWRIWVWDRDMVVDLNHCGLLQGHDMRWNRV
jgi:hypothetical protein